MYLIVSLFYLQLQRIFYCTYNSRFMKFFSFNTLETWPHCLLDYFVFNKKTCVQFTFDLWKVISLSLFFLCAPKIFSLCLVFINLTTNFLGFVFFVLMLLKIHWVYWIFKLIFLSYLVNFHHICSNLFILLQFVSSLFYSSNYMYVQTTTWNCPAGHWGPVCLCSVLYSLCTSV